MEAGSGTALNESKCTLLALVENARIANPPEPVAPVENSEVDANCVLRALLNNRTLMLPLLAQSS